MTRFKIYKGSVEDRTYLWIKTPKLISNWLYEFNPRRRTERIYTTGNSVETIKRHFNAKLLNRFDLVINTNLVKEIYETKFEAI